MAKKSRIGLTITELFRLAGFAAGLGVVAVRSRLSRRVWTVGILFQKNKRLIFNAMVDAAAGLDAPRPPRTCFGKLVPQINQRPIPTQTPPRWLLSLIRRANCALTGAMRRDRVRFIVWGYTDSDRLGVDLKAMGFETRYTETGVLGFNAHERLPLISYMPDGQRPHFDGRGDSDLEALLNSLRSGWWRDDPALTAFHNVLVRSNAEKYRVINAPPDVALTPQDVLIVGQVPFDQAWAYTDTTVKDNIDLILSVIRDLGEDRRYIYKPHPFNPGRNDEIARLRAIGAPVEIANPDTAFRTLAKMGPTVAVNTSGAGLEAAFFGCPVVTYGAAYYAGWGATEDRMTFPRRRNTLTATDIYIATVGVYSRYIRRRDGAPAALAEVAAALEPKDAAQ